jgi:hypothetical protein
MRVGADFIAPGEQLDAVHDRQIGARCDIEWTIPSYGTVADWIWTGLIYYYVTTIVVMLGVFFGRECVEFCDKHPLARHGSLTNSLCAWDGVWYIDIVTNGYSYHRDRMSTVAFFPAYPLLASVIARVSGLGPEVSLLVVSHFSLLCAFVTAAAYLHYRLPGESNAPGYVLLMMGLLPSTLYFRMAYTESLFLLLVVLMLYGMQRKWPVWGIAIIVGAATGTRSVGVMLGVPLLIYLWSNSKSILGALRTGLVVAPLACWGLGGYIYYQWSAFGEPLAFAKTQAHWSKPGIGPANLTEKIFGLLTLQPIWQVYDATCSCYWALVPPQNVVLFNLAFMNPIALLASFVILGYGARSRMLSTLEWTLGVSLLILPYLMHADRTCMMGEVRYTSVVFPIYMVLGQWLARMPPPVTAVIASCSGFLLAVYSALFVQWYWFY